MKFVALAASFLIGLQSLSAQSSNQHEDHAWLRVKVLHVPDTSLELIDTLIAKTTSYLANEDSNQYRVVEKAIIKIKKAASLLGADYVELNEPKIEPIRFITQGNFAIMTTATSFTMFASAASNYYYYYNPFHYYNSNPILYAPSLGSFGNGPYYLGFVPPKSKTLGPIEGYRCIISARILKSKHQSKINALKAAVTERALFSVVSRYRINTSGAVHTRSASKQTFSISNYEAVDNRLYTHLELRGAPIHKFTVVYIDEKKLLLSWKRVNTEDDFILAFRNKPKPLP